MAFSAKSVTRHARSGSRSITRKIAAAFGLKIDRSARLSVFRLICDGSINIDTIKSEMGVPEKVEISDIVIGADCP